MKLIVLDDAEADLAEAVLWYEDQQPGLSDRFMSEYMAALTSIENFPESFSLLETLREPFNIRRAVLPHFPYAIIFELRDDSIVVLTVSHTARHPQHWQKRLGGRPTD